MGTKPMLTNYVSEIDQVLQQFDKANPNLSKSQLKEIENYRRIYFLRDSVDYIDENKNPVDSF